MATETNLASLLVEHEPIPSTLRVPDVAALFADSTFRRSLSIPVVDDGVPVGVVSRYRLAEIYMNPYGRELHRKTPVREVMNGKPLIVPLEQPMEAAALYVSNNMPFPLTEDFIVTENGRYRGIGFVLDLLRAMEQQVSHHAAELAGAYKELKASQTRLVQSEKMASLGQMVAGVAHEINTPLGYVRNNVELKREVFQQSRELLQTYRALFDAVTAEPPDEARVQGLMAALQELSEGLSEEDEFEDIEQLYHDTLYGIEQISELVLGLKNFSRVDHAKVTDVNLNECIDSALLIGKNNIKHRAEVIKEFKELPSLSCSPSQLNQVFLNLVTNAAQAIDHDRGKLLLKTFYDERNVYATVEDNGRGIPADKLKRIFDPFFTTKAVGEGTGLGLSISYQIIEQHGGSIRVASKPGVGTKFLVTLPRNAEALRQAS